MFKVPVDTIEKYLAFDPKRTSDLKKLDALIRASAPSLKRYFHAGTPAGQPGMRFKMIGYGRTHYIARDGTKVEWPIIGVALQKNYISVYVSAKRNGMPLAGLYAATLNALRCSESNFSFVRFEDLNAQTLASLVNEAAQGS